MPDNNLHKPWIKPRSKGHGGKGVAKGVTHYKGGKGKGGKGGKCKDEGEEDDDGGQWVFYPENPDDGPPIYGPKRYNPNPGKKLRDRKKHKDWLQHQHPAKSTHTLPPPPPPPLPAEEEEEEPQPEPEDIPLASALDAAMAVLPLLQIEELQILAEAVGQTLEDLDAYNSE